MSAGGYARVSTVEQAGENQSLPAQKRKIDSYCKQNDIPLLKVFEGSESARTADRIGLQHALDYCRENRNTVSQFVVCDLSRLARNNFDQAQIIVELKSLGVTFVSIDEPLTDDSALGQFVRNMFGSVHQFFSDTFVDNNSSHNPSGGMHERAAERIGPPRRCL
jgi:site-specific DNA recombinase